MNGISPWWLAGIPVAFYIGFALAAALSMAQRSDANEAKHEPQGITPCGAYRCPGANDQLCEACRANPKLTGARHA